MFDNLIESKPKSTKSGRQLVTSMVLHVLLVAALVWATKGAAETVKKIMADTTMVFLEPPKAPPPPDQPPPDAVVAANPPPQGFQVVLPPSVVPTAIPPVDLSKHFDAKDFSGKGVEGGIAAGIVGGTGPVDNTQVFMEAQVDEIPTVASTRPPRYPEVLRAAGINGRVLMQFVVDTTGHVEESTLKIISTPHPGFNNAAKEAVLGTVFHPGKMHGSAVAVLVQQAVNFTQ